MKKRNKNFVVFIGIIFTLFFCMNFVEATLGNGFNTSKYNSVTSEQSTGFERIFSKVGGSIILILQIAGLAGVVITGVKYMYANSEDKGKIKQTLIWLIIGTIFVFAAPRVIDFVTKIGNTVL